MIILGCIHALLLAEATTTQLVDVHGRTVQQWGAEGLEFVRRAAAAERSGAADATTIAMTPCCDVNSLVMYSDYNAQMHYGMVLRRYTKGEKSMLVVKPTYPYQGDPVEVPEKDVMDNYEEAAAEMVREVEAAAAAAEMVREVQAAAAAAAARAAAHPEYTLNSQLNRTYHGAPMPTTAHSSAFDVAKRTSLPSLHADTPTSDGEAAEPSPTPLPNEILRAAATGDLLPVFKWLRKGGPIDALCTHPTAEGQTIEVGLLHASAATGHLEMVQWLLQRGASVDLQANSLPSRGGTPLMQAASYGHVSTVLLLLQHSANPNVQDIYGNTALMLATTQGHVACVQALLRAGANTELFNFETKHTALQWAESKGQPEIAELVLQHACRSRGLGVALCAVLQLTRLWYHRCIDDPLRVVLGTVAFVALLNLVVVSLKLTAGLGHHRAATQRRPPHRGARSSKAKGRKTAAEPLHQCAAPSQPAAPLMKSKRKAKVGRATARGDGEVAALEGALAAVPRNAREGGVAAEERYVGEEKLEKWRQDAAEREARQEAAAEAARLAVLEREEAKAATTSPAPAPAATTPSASKFRANAKPWVPTSDAKACVRTVQPPPEPAMALATAMQEVVAPPATADALEVVADALEQLVAVGSEGGINGAAGPSEASKEAEVPDDYMCSITAEIMTDPVCASDGFTYEREAITAWLRTNDTSPLTGATLESKVLNPNLSLRGMIRRFVAAQAPTAL